MDDGFPYQDWTYLYFCDKGCEGTVVTTYNTTEILVTANMCEKLLKYHIGSDLQRVLLKVFFLHSFSSGKVPIWRQNS